MSIRLDRKMELDTGFKEASSFKLRLIYVLVAHTHTHRVLVPVGTHWPGQPPGVQQHPAAPGCNISQLIQLRHEAPTMPQVDRSFQVAHFLWNKTLAGVNLRPQRMQILSAAHGATIK